MSTLERLERANPVADADRLLSAPGAMDDFVLAVKERSGIVQTAEDRPPIEVPPETKRETQAKPSPDPRRRRGLWVAAAALVVAVIAAGVVITMAGGDDEPDVASDGVLASAESLYTAFNQGDFDTYRSLFAPGAALGAGRNWNFLEGVQAGPVPTVSPASFGLQLEAECVEGNPTLVRCTWVQRGGVFERVGIEVTSEVEVFFNQDGAIFNLVAPFDDQAKFELFADFYPAFGIWLREAHPDVFEATYDTPPDLQLQQHDAIDTLESRAQWAAVLDEFLTQSDVYPLGG